MADENGYEGITSFEDGMHWLLPTNVLEEADTCDQKKAQLTSQEYHHQSIPPHSRTQTAAEWLRSGQPRPQRSRNGTNAKCAFGGPGMQAVFLDSGRQGSCGTGVFLPRRAGTRFHSPSKPACPPVLLPSRVVQALNLNVHELGLRKQNPHQDCNGQKSRGGGGHDCNMLHAKRRNNIDASRGGGAGEWRSPEIFLPKEWTY